MSIFDQLPGATRSVSASFPETVAPTCSRKACGNGADWQLLWNNPRIHTPERRKVWLACGDHREWLEEYLSTRGLWKETLPLKGSPASS